MFETVPDDANPNVLKVNGMVEKLKAEVAPSMYAGEVQLTDAIALLIAEGHTVHVVVHRAPRHDLGTPGGYLKAAVDFAIERDDYGPELRRWLIERLELAEG